MRLRALAHPVRWKLIDLLGREGSATATRCADVLGESVASCSYHLGILGKYGYIEHVPDTVGREKPWQPVSDRLDFDEKALDPEEELALEAVAESFLEHELESVKIRLRRVSLEPPEWRDAVGMGASTMYVTPDELREFKAEWMAALSRFADRDHEPARRPPGARQARVFFTTFLDPPRD
jgi:hypothetical protein